MLEIKERDPFSSLVLEVLDDPQKKEMVFYVMCYSQLVRREGSFHVELERFLSCAYRSFKNARNHWKDVLVELNLFVVSDLYGNLYTGKDIYKLEEGEIYLISLRKEYLPLFESISYRAFRLWNMLNRTLVYRKHLTAQDAVFISAFMFNEGLYEELRGYCELNMERYPLEAPYFRALRRLSGAYAGKGEGVYQELKGVLAELQGLGQVYYGVNLLKLTRDVENLMGRVEKGKGLETIRIEFVSQKRKGEGWLRTFLKRLKDIFVGLWVGGKGSKACFSKGELCSRSSLTPSTSS
ncbi:MAG: hypothetical protein RMK21_04690 [Aquificaceae bacterium]|nr:hypothetical protein [Aquificaceae bacterium]MDW8294635.1 hypothetical protein [Aquificaceae bacterium]